MTRAPAADKLRVVSRPSPQYPAGHHRSDTGEIQPGHHILSRASGGKLRTKRALISARHADDDKI